MLIRLLKGIKGQSTAEYGVLFGVIIAIAAGALTVSLKNAIQSKHDKSLEFMLGAGTTTLEDALEGGEGHEAALAIFATGEEVRQTTTDNTTYRDERVRHKGGAEQAIQLQDTATDSVAINKIVAGAE